MSTPTSIATWLERDELPDFYRLLGRRRLDPDVTSLKAAIHAATRELLPFQNHADAAKARRAMRLMFELGRAEDLLADPRRLDEFKQRLTVDLLADCCAHFGKGAAQWGQESVRHWLESACDVHPAASRKAAATLLEKSGNARPIPIRVFGPAAAKSGVVAKDSPSDTGTDDLPTPIAAKLLPSDDTPQSSPQPQARSLPVTVPTWPAPVLGTLPIAVPAPRPAPSFSVVLSPVREVPLEMHLHVERADRSKTTKRLSLAGRAVVLAVLMAWVPAVLVFAVSLARAPRPAETDEEPASPAQGSGGQIGPPARRADDPDEARPTRANRDRVRP